MNKFMKNTSLAVLLATILGFGAIAPAFADECSDAIDAVEQAQNETDLSEEQNASISEALATAVEQQEAGEADSCLASLADSMVILGIE